MRDPAELLSAYFDDSLAEGELAELRAWLAGDRERLAQFVRASVIHSRLRDVLMQHDMRGLVFDGVFGDAVDPQHIAGLLDEDEEASARRAQEAAELARRQAMAAAPRGELLDRSLMRVEEPRVPRWLVYSSMAAAAVLLVMVGRLMGPAPAPAPNAGLAARAPAEPPIVAEVANTFDARLRSGTRVVATGAKLYPGSLIVERGVAEVTFAAGAKLVVEGPAALELMTADRARLVRGRVVAYVPDQALGFTLHSQAASFVDLGTEFGVEIDGAGQASVHVLDGEIALVSEQKATPSRTLQRGVANEVSVDGSIRDIPFDEARFLRRVPASAYELAVLKSRPLAYWRLNATSPNSTIVSEGQLAASALVSGGVTTADNRGGRGAQGGRVAPGGPAHAALFDGEHDGIETPGDAALGLVSNCTLEAWVLPTARATGPQRIFSTFDRPRSGIALGVVDGRWYKLPDDDLKFHLTVYGDYDCISATPIAPEQWVHLAATIDAAGTPTLYVDGAAVERRFRPLGLVGEPLADDQPAEQPAAPWPAEAATPIGRTTAGQARIGRNPVGSDGQVSPERYQGQISNVAVYDRVLGPNEIQQHVRATRDAATDDRDEQQ